MKYFISLFLLLSLFIGVPVSAATMPQIAAQFETSLASPVSSSAGSMTLSANSIRGGTTLSGYSCFTIDEGSSQSEYVCGTVSGTSVTGIARGISPYTGTTTITGLQYSHRRGANIKITDSPILLILRNQLSGVETIPNPLEYATTTATSSFTSSQHIVDKDYVDYVAFNGAGVISATESAKGVIELATTVEQASSSVSGSSGPLVLQAKNATSTYNSATAGLKVVVTQNDGKIDSNFIATSTLFATSTKIGDLPVYHVGGRQVITTTGTSTFTVPTGITKLFVQVQAGGGNGGSSSAGTPGTGGGGGGGGGYSEKTVDVTGTSTIQVYVGAAGLKSEFGTNGFYFSALPGNSGTDANNTGTGGCGVNGDLNLCGSAGANYSQTSNRGIGGTGGSSFLGGGGIGGLETLNGAENGRNYGGGAGGGADGSSGANGAQGVVIVQW